MSWSAQLGICGILIALGLYGMFAPYEWNVLRLKWGVSGLFSDETNRTIPKVIGSLLILAGIILAIATAFGYRMK